MDRKTLDAILHLAGIDYIQAYEVENRYWPKAPNYDQIRREQPWWLVWTKHGPILIGWRKRVIQIEWPDLIHKVKCIVTKDDVTKEETLVHAWTTWKAVEYLFELRRQMERAEYTANNPNTVHLPSKLQTEGEGIREELNRG
jgi:hypothetical protein